MRTAGGAGRGTPVGPGRVNTPGGPARLGSRVLSADHARGVSRRLSQARARPRAFSESDRTLSQPRIDAGRYGARAAERFDWRRARDRSRGRLRDAQHDPFGERARMARGVPDLGGRWALSRADERRAGGVGRRAAPDVRGEHAGARRAVPQLSDAYVRPQPRPCDGPRVAIFG